MLVAPPNEQVRAAEIARAAIELGKTLVGCDGSKIDKEIETFILDSGGKPALKGYRPVFAMRPYDWTICLAVNEDVVHGVPNKYTGPAQLITIDLVVEVDGWFADMARTFTISGEPHKQQFVANSLEVFHAGLSVIHPNASLNTYAAMIDNAARLFGYGVIKEYCGHGIGRTIHAAPQICNYPTPTREVFQVGHSYAVEPVLAIRPTYSLRHEPNDGFSVRADCLTSHNEDTIFVSPNGIVNLTGNQS